MNEAILILPNMRGGCATVGNTVHTLFRVTEPAPSPDGRPGLKACLAQTARRDDRRRSFGQLVRSGKSRVALSRFV